MNKHDGHKLVYVYDRCTVQQVCEITAQGDVLVTGYPDVIDFDGSPRVYCDTCNEPVREGEGGLAEDWILT